VHLNSADLSGFQVADAEVQQRYRYKNLKAAMCHIPDGKELGGPVSTKVGLLCGNVPCDIQSAGGHIT
jgi:hypothetical protein